MESVILYKGVRISREKGKFSYTLKNYANPISNWTRSYPNTLKATKSDIDKLIEQGWSAEKGWLVINKK